MIGGPPHDGAWQSGHWLRRQIRQALQARCAPVKASSHTAPTTPASAVEVSSKAKQCLRGGRSRCSLPNGHRATEGRSAPWQSTATQAAVAESLSQHLLRNAGQKALLNCPWGEKLALYFKRKACFHSGACHSHT